MNLTSHKPLIGKVIKLMLKSNTHYKQECLANIL
jgi:hypothetical protein